MTDARTAELLAALESDMTLEAGGPFLKIAADLRHCVRADRFFFVAPRHNMHAAGV